MKFFTVGRKAVQKKGKQVRKLLKKIPKSLYYSRKKWLPYILCTKACVYLEGAQNSTQNEKILCNSIVNKKEDQQFMQDGKISKKCNGIGICI